MAASKPFEIHVTVDAPALAQAITDLSLAIRDRVPVIQPTQDGAEAVIPAGTPMTVAGVQTAPQAPAPAPVPQPAPAAPVQAAPVPPAAPAPVPQPAATVAAPQAAPAAPVPQEAPVASNVVQFPQQAQAAPVQGATQGGGVTMDAIINAGASLVEKGMMAQVVGILQKYGIQAVNQLQPPQFEAFAAELRTLGAQI